MHKTADGMQINRMLFFATVAPKCKENPSWASEGTLSHFLCVKSWFIAKSLVLNSLEHCQSSNTDFSPIPISIWHFQQSARCILIKNLIIWCTLIRAPRQISGNTNTALLSIAFNWQKWFVHWMYRCKANTTNHKLSTYRKQQQQQATPVAMALAVITPVSMAIQCMQID